MVRGPQLVHFCSPGLSLPFDPLLPSHLTNSRPVSALGGYIVANCTFSFLLYL